MDFLSASTMLVTSVLINVSSIGDAFVDLLALGIRRTPRSDLPLDAKTPTIGVLVASWDEDGVLERMVEGNLARIHNPDVCFYLGVYPNDDATRDAAFALERQYRGRVVTIVNTLAGPTSKGQMLNEMFRRIYADDGGPELAVLHDSEDVIDPRTFDVYAHYARQFDYIQVPVFSFDSRHRSLVAETYMDEFAERHTREMIVRNAVGAPIPSAGVGTCLSRRLVRHFVRSRGNVLMTGCVTEDYILGIEAKRAGFKCCFAAMSADDFCGHDYVATREYFPRKLAAAIKQKTRWVYGINFEAAHRLGWKGGAWDRYFFLRDRKGTITNFLPAISLVLMLLLLTGLMSEEIPSAELERWIAISIWLNFGFLLLRYWVRVNACRQVYGIWDFTGVAVRWPIALLINMVAVWRAWKIYLFESDFARRSIAWSKTTHEIPDDFSTVKR